MIRATSRTCTGCTKVLPPPKSGTTGKRANREKAAAASCMVDLADIKGQESAKRALEIAAAGGHSLLMCGPPGCGKSLLAATLPALLPPLEAHEALETSQIHSLAGTLPEGGLVRARPFRSPHHTASQAALVGEFLHEAGRAVACIADASGVDDLPPFCRIGSREQFTQPGGKRGCVVIRAAICC